MDGEERTERREGRVQKEVREGRGGKIEEGLDV
jgi:hypothetical protein